MKKILFLVILTLTLQTYGQKVAPKIFVKDNIYDFKEVPQNKVLKHSFVIENKGSAPLEIKEVKPSCECTVLDPIKMKLEPGDTTVLTVKFDTKNKIGYQRQHAYILSNDPEAPVYRVSIVANVQLSKEAEEQLPTIRIPYTTLDLGEVKQGETVSSRIEIRNYGKKTLVIKKVKSGCDFIKLKLSNNEIIYGKPEFLNVSVNTKNISGKQSCTVIIKSNDPRTRVAILTLFVNVVE